MEDLDISMVENVPVRAAVHEVDLNRVFDELVELYCHRVDVAV